MVQRTGSGAPSTGPARVSAAPNARHNWLDRAAHQSKRELAFCTAMSDQRSWIPWLACPPRLAVSLDRLN